MPPSAKSPGSPIHHPLPEVIHIGNGTSEDEHEHEDDAFRIPSPPVLVPPHKKRNNITCGILKPSSYCKYSGNNRNKNNNKNNNSNNSCVSNPKEPFFPKLKLRNHLNRTTTNANATTNTNTNTNTNPLTPASPVVTASASLSASLSVSSPGSSDSTSTCESGSGDDSLDRIICNLNHSIVHNANLSPQRPSSSSLSLSASSSLASSTSPPRYSNSNNKNNNSSNNNNNSEEEQRLRNARIRHIEDLNERIKAAKARKLVERKAYRREDRLMLRLARELKTTSKHVAETEWKNEQLEAINERLQEYCDRSKKELNELRTSRLSTTLKKRLSAENDIKLANVKSAHNFVLQNQASQLEALNTGHQSNCQELCESVLDANFELDRLRAILVSEQQKNAPKGWFAALLRLRAKNNGNGNNNNGNGECSDSNSSGSVCPSPTRRRRRGMSMGMGMSRSPSRRLRGSIGSFSSTGSLTRLHSQSLSQAQSQSRAKNRTRSSESGAAIFATVQWWSTFLTVVLLGILVVAGTLSVVENGSGSGNDTPNGPLGAKATTAAETIVSNSIQHQQQQQQQQHSIIDTVELPERTDHSESPALAYSKILALEETAAIADDLLASPKALLLNTKTSCPSKGRNKNNSNNNNKNKNNDKSDFVCTKDLLATNNSGSHEAADEGGTISRTAQTTLSPDASARTRNGVEDNSSNNNNNNNTARRRHGRPPKTNQFVASVARLVVDGTTLGTIIRRE